VSLPAAAPYLVGITGGSGSGKTTLTRALAEAFGSERVGSLSLDAYYRDRGDLPASARAELNYDLPEAFDRELFVRDLRALRAGRAVRPPAYCFATHRRVGQAELVEPRDLVVVDGILLLHDPEVRGLLDYRIYLDVPAVVRLARRVARDTAERGRSAAAVLGQYTTTVGPAHAAYVEPTRAFADLVLRNLGAPGAVAEIATTMIRSRLALRREPGLATRRPVSECGP
jgi:uridine kinase